MNDTTFIQRTSSKIKQHSKVATWSSLILAVVGLIIQAFNQHYESNNNHTAIWTQLRDDEKQNN
jgi:hypothetical protein